MCGIIATISKIEASTVMLGALERLTYRGYDSAGIATHDGSQTYLLKRSGKINELLSAHQDHPCPGTVGIGHTRWATHGSATETNAHPHHDAAKRYFVVCNGIIENFRELRESLEAKGVVFVSETDTEVIAQRVSTYNDSLSLKEKVLKLVTEIQGSYSFVIFDSEQPNQLWSARQGSPLLLARGKEGHFLGSDIPAVLEFAEEVVYLKDHEVAGITVDGAEFYDFQGNVFEPTFEVITQNLEQAQKEGYPHYMLKEIYEQADVVERTMNTYMNDGGIDFSCLEKTLDVKRLSDIDDIYFVACGTAYNAGLVGQYLFEALGMKARAVLASEFHLFPPPITENTLVIAVTQSGETVDTLFAMRHGKKKGALTCAICNVKDSTISRESDMCLMMQAGIEIAVASTKAYSTMLTVLQLLGPWLADKKTILRKSFKIKKYLEDLRKLPSQIKVILGRYEQLKKSLENFTHFNDYFYIGRGFGLPTALEGALKLKEITYLHAEGYGAGEMKHGPIALIDDHMLTVALAPRDGLQEKTSSNLEEIRARGGKIFMISSDDCEVEDSLADWTFRVPETSRELSPSLSVIPLQILAYEVAISRGQDPDQPRNLAKSVTVE